MFKHKKRKENLSFHDVAYFVKNRKKKRKIRRLQGAGKDWQETAMRTCRVEFADLKLRQKKEIVLRIKVLS